MPVVLKFAVYQCECGEIFKKKEMLDRHCKKWRHNPLKEYTIIAKIARSNGNTVEVGVFEGKAEDGYV